MMMYLYIGKLLTLMSMYLKKSNSLERLITMKVIFPVDIVGFA